MEREDGDQGGDDDQLREEDRFGLFLGGPADQAHFTHHVESGHADLSSFLIENDEKSLNHHDGSIYDNAEIDRSHRQKVGAHSHQAQADEGKEQGERDDNGDNQCRSPVGHEEQDDKGDEQDALSQVVGHGPDRQVDQVFPVIERNDPDIVGQGIGLDLLDLIFERADYLFGILAFTHDDNAFNNVVLVHSPHLSEAWQARLVHVRQMFDQDWRPVDVFHDNILDLLDVIDQANTSYDIGLGAFRDDITSDIEITLGNGVEQLQAGYAVIDQLVGIDADLESLDLASETDNIGDTGNGS